MSLFTFVLDFFRTMLHLIWFSRKSFSNSLNIYVKSNTGSTLSVELDPKWDIKNVKEVIAPQLGMPPEEVKIILAGKELDDSLVIEVRICLRIIPKEHSVLTPTLLVMLRF